MSCRCGVDKRYRDLTAVPSADTVGVIQAGKRDMQFFQPLGYAGEVMLEPVGHQDKYLLYDEDIGANGLTWGELLEWYNNNHLPFDKGLLEKLWDAVKHCGSPIEEQFFSFYLEIIEEYGDNIPALLPQVYLFYDSKVQKERTVKIFDHQCMDFLMLFSGSQRVVIELDGVQHYSDGTVQIPDSPYPQPIASTAKYASMVSAQREMTLAGYEVYRFGGKEFQNQEQAKAMVQQFLLDLFSKHRIDLAN